MLFILVNRRLCSRSSHLNVHCIFVSFSLCISLHIVTASADDDPRLLVLLSVVDLLAACCKGRNDSVQSSCQNILTSDELLEVCMCTKCVVC